MHDDLDATQAAAEFLLRAADPNPKRYGEGESRLATMTDIPEG